MLLSFLLKKLGLKQINVDYSIFIMKSGLIDLIVSIFIDNIKIIAPKESGMIKRVKSELISVFSIVDIGPVSFYIGLKVEQN